MEEDQPDPGGEDEAEEAGVCTHSDVYNVYGFHNPEWDDDDGDDEPAETMRMEPWIGDFEPEFPTPEAIDWDPAVRHQRVRLAMLAIADGLNDAEAYWAEYRDHLPAAGQPERALAVLEAVPLRRGLRSDGYRRWLDAHLEALEALGRQEEA